ncbi:uncharacterized protein LOC62_04G006502 [Vanrija pseudolonga]|uniref:Uncharacterized protein n=1 Tax=Vanrija pseudolonga TaxID=143232 RepID=A0AAF1BJR1_9TREE|nr:hypothetical protein LOC62_04G006502 [Vanrija pseudolonga]
MFAQREFFVPPPVGLTARQRADLQRKHEQVDIDAARRYGLVVADVNDNASLRSVDEEKEAARREYEHQVNEAGRERETSWRRKIASAWRKLS